MHKPDRLLVAGMLVAAVNLLTASESNPTMLAVASIQMRSSPDLSNNVARIGEFIRKAGAEGARVVVFPECALSGYFEHAVTNLSAEELSAAEASVTKACRASGVFAVLGTPYRTEGRLFNSAVVVNPHGRVIARYHKIQLAESWPEAGDEMIVFKIEGVPCSIIICHDERYPELVRLPVLAGAQVIFYISHESGLDQQHKIAPYRAQIQARAVENTVFVVQANAPANTDKTGSHGQSRIIAPDGNILKEASVFDEEMITATLNVRRASRENARKSLTRGPLGEWWRDGVKRVRILDDSSTAEKERSGSRRQ